MSFLEKIRSAGLWRSHVVGVVFAEFPRAGFRHVATSPSGSSHSRSTHHKMRQGG